MRPFDRRRVASAIMSVIPGFVFKKKLIELTPRKRILRGLYMEDSSFTKHRFFLEAFVYPLYVPTDTLGFTFGFRIGGGSKYWIPDDNDTKALVNMVSKVAMPFLEECHDPYNLASWIQQNKIGPYAVQGQAYSLIACGRIKEGCKVLSELCKMLDPRIPWMADMIKEARYLQQLATTDPAAADRQLSKWETETIKNFEIDGLL